MYVGLNLAHVDFGVFEIVDSVEGVESARQLAISA